MAHNLDVVAEESDTKPQIVGQVATVFSDGTLSKGRVRASSGSGWNNKARDMRDDATISLVRQLVAAPVISAPWHVIAKKNAPAGAKEFIEEHFDSHRLDLLEKSVYGTLDYGWAPFEKVFGIDEEERLVVDWYKPLIQDYTRIRIDEATGEYTGLRQHNTFRSDKNGWVDLDVRKSFRTSINVEGTDWYGRPTMKAAELAYDNWLDINDAANRYDTKIAGSHWVVYFPIGTSRYTKSDGTVVEDYDNMEIAKDVLASIESSGSLAIPSSIKTVVEDMNDMHDSKDFAWRVELISDKGGKAGFVERQNYLDKLKVRAFGFPERAILQGEFGTKADAGEHANFAILNLELQHARILRDYNNQDTQFLMAANYGRKFANTVKIVSAPLIDSQRQLLKQVYMAIIQNGDLAKLEALNIDIAAIKEKIGVPKSEVNSQVKLDVDSIQEKSIGNGEDNRNRGSNVTNEAVA